MHAAFMVVTLALAPTGTVHHVDLDAGVDLQSGSAAVTQPAIGTQPGGARGSSTWLRAAGDFGVTIFPRGLRDDGAPPTLQGFLQRAGDVHLDGGGAGGPTHFPDLVPDETVPGQRVSFSGGHAGALAEGYRGWLYLSLAFSVDYSNWSYSAPPGASVPNSDGELILDPSMIAGVRWRELLIYGGWSVQPYRLDGPDQAFHVAHCSRAQAGFRAVIRRFIDLSAGVTLLDGGALAGATAEVWLARRLGLSVAVSGGHGAYYLDADALFDVAGGGVALDCWLTSNEELSVSYGATWVHPDGPSTAYDGFTVYAAGDSVTHVVSLSFRERR